MIKLSDVNFLHVRNYTDEGELASTGGLTVAFVQALDGAKDTLWAGLSKCSDRDPFSKRIGRLISEGRLHCGPKESGCGAYVIKVPMPLNDKISPKDLRIIRTQLTDWAIKEAYGC